MKPSSLHRVEFKYRTPKGRLRTRTKRPKERVKDEASNRMLYQLYQPYEDASNVLRSAAGSMSSMLARLPMGLPNALPVRSLRAAYDLYSDTKISHERPAFAIDKVLVNGTAMVTGWIAQILRYFQDGNVQRYAVVMAVSAVAILWVFLG